MLILLRQGRLSKWFSGMGQEAIAVGVTAALRSNDPILPLHRNLGVFTGRGLDLLTLVRQLLGRDGGYTAGRDRTFHFGAPAHHVKHARRASVTPSRAQDNALVTPTGCRSGVRAR